MKKTTKRLLLLSIFATGTIGAAPAQADGILASIGASITGIPEKISSLLGGSSSNDLKAAASVPKAAASMDAARYAIANSTNGIAEAARTAAFSNANCIDIKKTAQDARLAAVQRYEAPDPTRIIRDTTCFVDVISIKIPHTGIGFLDQVLSQLVKLVSEAACNSTNGFWSKIASAVINGNVTGLLGSAINSGTQYVAQQFPSLVATFPEMPIGKPIQPSLPTHGTLSPVVVPPGGWGPRFEDLPDLPNGRTYERFPACGFADLRIVGNPLIHVDHIKLGKANQVNWTARYNATMAEVWNLDATLDDADPHRVAKLREPWIKLYKEMKATGLSGDVLSALHAKQNETWGQGMEALPKLVMGNLGYVTFKAFDRWDVAGVVLDGQLPPRDNENILCRFPKNQPGEGIPLALIRSKLSQLRQQLGDKQVLIKTARVAVEQCIATYGPISMTVGYTHCQPAVDTLRIHNEAADQIIAEIDSVASSLPYGQEYED